MDMEELNTYLDTDEGKAFLDEKKEGLLNKNNELLDSIKELKTEVATIKQKEANAEAEAAKATRAADKAKAEKENDIESYKQLHADDLKAKDDKIDSLQTNFAKAELSRAVSSTAAKHSSTPKPLELLLRNRVNSSYDDNGALQINVLDEIGNVMPHATIDTLVDELRSADDNAPFFNSTGSSGAGTNKADTTTAVGKPGIDDAGYNLTKAMGNKVQ